MRRIFCTDNPRRWTKAREGSCDIAFRKEFFALVLRSKLESHDCVCGRRRTQCRVILTL